MADDEGLRVQMNQSYIMLVVSNCQFEGLELLVISRLESEDNTKMN